MIPATSIRCDYFWGTTGIGYNEAKIKKILGDTPLDSWNFIFDPKLIAKFKDCGVSVLDAPDEILKVTLAWMGRDPNSQKEEDLKAAEEKLTAIRPFIRKIHSSQYIEDLANGDLCVAVGWSGDILQSRDRAVEAGQGTVIKYAIPKEGTIVWFDMLAIPTDAKHPKNAHAFINYLMDPQVAANNSNFVNYANGNAASLAMVSDDGQERSWRLSDAGSEGEAVSVAGLQRRLQSPHDPYVDQVHDGQLTSGLQMCV